MEHNIVAVEGFHAIKHALRFHADITEIYATNSSNWRTIAANHAPDVIDTIEAQVKVIDERAFHQRFHAIHPTGLAGFARKPEYEISPAEDNVRTTPAILLEDPRRLNNVGAAIRVAAAARANSVITTGQADPWSPDAIRASAGLHFALPIERVDRFDTIAGPIIAMDAGGAPIDSVIIPPNAVLAFGTERDGLSDKLLKHADQVVSLPMRPGVSSLNLATSVAATLYLLARKEPR